MKIGRLLSALLLGLGSFFVGAQEPVKFASPADEFRALSAEWQSKFIASAKASESAKTDEELQKAEGIYPQTQKYVARIWELARGNPKEPFAVDALVWVVTHDTGNDFTGRPEFKAALDILIAEHVDSLKLAWVCPALDTGDSKPLRAILEKNPHRNVQGYACISLARNVLRFEPRFGQRPNPAEAEALFQRVVDQYADLKGTMRLGAEAFEGAEAIIAELAVFKALPATLGDEARSELFALRHLSVGKAAPEIAGEDVDGKKFKLSDYRGKVIVIDFWGDW